MLTLSMKIDEYREILNNEISNKLFGRNVYDDLNKQELA